MRAPVGGRLSQRAMVKSGIVVQRHLGAGGGPGCGEHPFLRSARGFQVSAMYSDISQGIVQVDARIVVLSGPVGSGKTTLARSLAAKFKAVHIRTQDLMADVAAGLGIVLEPERRAMQKFGGQLDRDTDEQWVADQVAKLAGGGGARSKLLIVDAVRTLRQVEALREVFPAAVTHIHVNAPETVLTQRYQDRRDSGFAELGSYQDVAADPTEANVVTLASDADITIDTHRCSELDVLARATAALNLYPSLSDRLVDVYIGGQYGSEGKGNIAYHLANEYDLLMRVGGPNAGHKVPTAPPYTHRLLPSGTLGNPRAMLVIGPGATLDLTVLMQEIAACSVDDERLSIDPQAMIIEAADLEKEAELVKTIASTGKGGGAAAARRIMGRHGGAYPKVRLARDVPELTAYVRSTADILEAAFRDGKKVMLEGTQGTLLSLFHGFYPWVTSRDTTTAACLSEAGIGPHRLRKVVMVVRTYPIRVGDPPASPATSGVMGAEIDWSEIAERSGLNEEKLRDTERGSVSGSKRRVAEFDWNLLRRASELNGATDIALTFADYLSAENLHARRFDQLTDDTIRFVEEVSRVGGAPVSLIATGFDNRALIDRREW